MKAQFGDLITEPDKLVQRKSSADLERQITDLAGHLNAGQYRFLMLIAEFDRGNFWSEAGAATSCAHWLNWKCGIDLGAAREKIRVAHALQTLPKISAAMEIGVLSYSKVRALTRVATPANEADLLALAEEHTAAHVERLVRGFRRENQSAEVARESAQFNGRSMLWFHDIDGSLVVKARLPAEAGALVIKAIEAAAHLAWGSSRPSAEATLAEVPLLAQRRADALVAVAEAALAGSSNRRAAPEHRQIVVHVDAGALAARKPGRCEIQDGPAISIETARRLSCDSTRLTLIKDSTGHPLSVGRRTRTIPPAISRALHVRDKGCRFPGCTQQRFLDGHHVRHWAEGGETRLTNLVLLCRFHHRQVHEGNVAVHRLDDGAWHFVRRCDGRTIEPAGHTRGSLQGLREVNRFLEKSRPVAPTVLRPRSVSP